MEEKNFEHSRASLKVVPRNSKILVQYVCGVAIVVLSQSGTAYKRVQGLAESYQRP